MLPSSRRAIEVRRNDYSDLAPVDRDEFFNAVGPCLALAGAVGMNEGDRREWLEAAFIAVGDMPIGLLEEGAKAALRTADHPSKIVPAIMKAVGEDWRRRQRVWTPERIALPEKRISDDERLHVGKLMSELVKSLGDATA